MYAHHVDYHVICLSCIKILFDNWKFIVTFSAHVCRHRSPTSYLVFPQWGSKFSFWGKCSLLHFPSLWLVYFALPGHRGLFSQTWIPRPPTSLWVYFWMPAFTLHLTRAVRWAHCPHQASWGTWQCKLAPLYLRALNILSYQCRTMIIR